MSNMIGAIPNPKKSLSIEFPVAVVREAVIHIKDLNDKYQLTKADHTLNIYTYASFEALSLGVYIDFSIAKKSETSTELTIEVKRKLGAFDKWHEVTLANRHIDTVTAAISTFIGMPETEKEKIRVKYAPQPAATAGVAKHKFNCGNCKQAFFIDPATAVIAICPHCKTNNTLLKPGAAKGCLGIIVTVLGLVSGGLFLLLFALG